MTANTIARRLLQQSYKACFLLGYERNFKDIVMEPDPAQCDFILVDCHDHYPVAHEISNQHQIPIIFIEHENSHHVNRQIEHVIFGKKARPHHVISLLATSKQYFEGAGNYTFCSSENLEKNIKTISRNTVYVRYQVHVL